MNSFSVPFVFDDRVAIVNDPAIKDLKQIWRVFLADTAGEIRPLVSLGFAFNYYWSELNVFGYHFVNLFLHTLNGFFVYLVVDRSLRFSRVETSSANFSLPALSAALFFMVHPIQTEAVTYIWGRPGLLFPASQSLLAASTVMGLSVLGLLIGLAIFLRHRAPAAAFGVAWFFLTFSFYFFFPLPDFFVERRMSLPSVGLFLSAAVLLPCSSEHRGAVSRYRT